MKTHEMVVFFEVRGNHAHLSIFTGKVGNQRGLAGQLVMTKDELEAWGKNEMVIVFKPRET